MAREPLQVIVIPFRRKNEGEFEFAVFHRSDGSGWQFISGGAEDQEDALQAARREAEEEASIPSDAPLIRLDSRASVPRTAFTPIDNWPEDIFVVPEFSFAVELRDQKLILSHEHDEVRWLSFKEATKLLTWDSNQTALWELNERLVDNRVRPV